MKTKDIVMTGLLSAIVFLGVSILKFQPPFLPNNGGLVHLGTAMMVIINIVWGRKKCAYSAAIGMTLFDILSGYANWAIATFIIRFIMGNIMGYLSEIKFIKNKYLINIFSALVSGIFMTAGYYIAGAIIAGDFIAPIQSLPFDFLQVGIAIVIGIPVGFYLKHNLKFLEQA